MTNMAIGKLAVIAATKVQTIPEGAFAYGGGMRPWAGQSLPRVLAQGHEQQLLG
jgi:hypothetical protein